LKPNKKQLVAGFPGSVSQLGGKGEGCSISGLRIVISEIIDQFLDAYGIRRRKSVVVDETAYVGVRGGVDIDGKG